MLLPVEPRFGDAHGGLVAGEVDVLDDRALAGEPRQVERVDAQVAGRDAASRARAVDRQAQIALHDSGVARRRLAQQRRDAPALQDAGEGGADLLPGDGGAEHRVAGRVLDRNALQFHQFRPQSQRHFHLRAAVEGGAGIDFERAVRRPGDALRREAERRLRLEAGRHATLLERPAHQLLAGDALRDR